MLFALLKDMELVILALSIEVFISYKRQKFPACPSAMLNFLQLLKFAFFTNSKVCEPQCRPLLGQALQEITDNHRCWVLTALHYSKAPKSSQS